MYKLLPHLCRAVGRLASVRNNERCLPCDRSREGLVLSKRRYECIAYHNLDAVTISKCLFTDKRTCGREVHLFKMRIVGKCLPDD